MDGHTAATRPYRLDTDLARVRPSFGEEQPPSVGGFVGVLFDKQRTKIQKNKRAAIAHPQHLPKPRDSPIFALPSSQAQQQLHRHAGSSRQPLQAPASSSRAKLFLSPTPRALSSEHADRYPSAAPPASVSRLMGVPQPADGYPSASSPLARSLRSGTISLGTALARGAKPPKQREAPLPKTSPPHQAAELSSQWEKSPYIYNR